MTMSKITLPVSPHLWRCIDEDGTQCPWLRVTRLGTEWTCKIFCEQGVRGRWEPLKTRGGDLGCLEKHPDCIAASEVDHEELHLLRAIFNGVEAWAQYADGNPHKDQLRLRFMMAASRYEEWRKDNE
jgi:hypothetical protein